MRNDMRRAVTLLALGVIFCITTQVRADDRSTEKPATRDYAAVRDAAEHHVDSLLPTLAQNTRPQETLQGVVTAIDERSDRISVRLASNDNSEFKIQDGLIFNAVRNGDRVEITVENIGGVKTIVALKKL